MVFSTQIKGIPCQCQVHGPNLQFEMLDRSGKKSVWLDHQVTQDDKERLLDEFQAAMLALKYGIDY